MNKSSNKYDLEERTAIFIPLLDQLIRAATSIGANYCEANGASSKKDFTNKIFICKKESRESKYWLRVLAGALNEEKLKDECRDLWKEAQEFNLIFSKIVSKK